MRQNKTIEGHTMAETVQGVGIVAPWMSLSTPSTAGDVHMYAGRKRECGRDHSFRTQPTKCQFQRSPHGNWEDHKTSTKGL